MDSFLFGLLFLGPYCIFVWRATRAGRALSPPLGLIESILKARTNDSQPKAHEIHRSRACHYKSPSLVSIESVLSFSAATTMASNSSKFWDRYGYDLLLGSIAAFYVLMVPYTKVEESFNIQVCFELLSLHPGSNNFARKSLNRIYLCVNALVLTNCSFCCTQCGGKSKRVSELWNLYWSQS